MTEAIGKKKSKRCSGAICLILPFLGLASVAAVVAFWYITYAYEHSSTVQTHEIGPDEVEIVVEDLPEEPVVPQPDKLPEEPVVLQPEERVVPQPEEPVDPQPIENLAATLDEMYDSL